MAIFYSDTGSFEILTVTNLTATTSSILYITQSQLNVTNNLITVNTSTPAVRFGGFAVIDSGSTGLSGSLLFDSQNNQWIYVHQSAPAAATTSSVLIMGPQTFNNIGNETTITANKLTKGSGGDLGEHITSSNVTDTGTLVSINSNTEVTGSLIVTAGITGSLFGTASYISTLRATGSVNTIQYSDGTNLKSTLNLIYANSNLELTNGSIIRKDATQTLSTIIGPYQGTNEMGMWGTDDNTSNNYLIATYFPDTAKYYYAGSNLVYNNANSRLGIGTSTPTATLQVVGNISATSITGSSATISGDVTINGSLMVGNEIKGIQGQVISLAQANYTIT